MTLTFDRGEFQASGLAGSIAIDLDRAREVVLDGVRGDLRLDTDRTDVTLLDLAIENDSLVEMDRTDTMEEELKEAGAGGYRFSATQGGETAFGGREAVVVMERDTSGTTYRFLLLATSRTGTMQEELNGVPADYELVGFTVFSSRFGGNEAAAILQAADAPESRGGSSGSVFTLDGGIAPEPQAAIVAVNYVNPRFFDTVDIPVLRGRGFPEENATGDRRVAVVSQSAAQQFWPGRNPIGRRIVNAEMGGPPLAVPPYRRFLGGRSRARPPCAGGRCRRRAAGSGGPATAPRRALHHPSTEGAVGPPAQAVAHPVRLICSSSRLSRRDPDMGTGSPGISRPSRTTCSMSARTRSTPPHDRPSGAPMAFGRSPGCAGGPSRFGLNWTGHANGHARRTREP